MPGSSSPSRDRPTLVVGGAYLALGTIVGSIGPVSDQLRSELDLSATVTGLYGSAFGWALLGFALLGGPVRTRLGDRRLFLAGLAGIVVAVALVCSARVVGLSLAGAVLIGLTATSIVLSAPTLIAARHPEHGARSEAFTFVNALSTAGAVVAPLALAATLDLGLGWRLPWAAIVALVGGSVLWTAVCSPLPESHEGAGSTAGPIAILRRSSGIRRRSLLLFLGVGIEFATLLWGSTVIQELGGASASAGAVAVGLFGVGMLIGRLFGPAVTRNLDQTLVLRMVFLGALVTTLALRFAPGVLPRVAATAAVGLCISLAYPYAFHRLYGPRVTDTEVSTIGGFADGVAIAVAPFLLGALADRFGIGGAILIAPVMAAGALVLLSMPDDASLDPIEPAATPLPLG